MNNGIRSPRAVGSVAFRLERSCIYLARGRDSAYASHRDRLSRTKDEYSDVVIATLGHER
jgi:hypothetical protein